MDLIKLMGYKYAGMNFLVALWLAVRSIAHLGSPYENDLGLALEIVLCLLWTAFCVLLIIGIYKDISKHVHKYLLFVRFRSLCVFLYLSSISVNMMVDLGHSESIPRMLVIGILILVVLALIVGIFFFELWALEHFKKYIESKRESMEPFS
ncbi:uncharacterized protein LOC129756592 [Uranotaenia lowii]|uniref:uncharacterized protein LOC129756592 n=1 Tax=Uranotaenia lowii TaxID=190385 RepID=UPI0024797CFD|nr:uncharacterized protein LOC129756592 [Uranotaenia lowii]